MAVMHWCCRINHLKMKGLSVAVLLSLAVGIVVGAGTESQRSVGQFTPRFEYEYKALLKLIYLKAGEKCCNETKQNTNSDNINSLYAEMRALQKNVKDLMTSQQTTGSVYTRWGRSTCPTGTELVYEGYTAGANFGNTGGAVNPLCLPKNPDAHQHSNTKDKNYGYIYGAEYEVQNGAFFPGGKSVFESDVPCAVCRSSHASVVMVPGKNQCQAGWRLEYTGYLMSGKHDHPAASQYTCIDGAPETVPGSSHNHNGYLFYMVIAKCGSLKCPPYAQDQVMICAVCSK